MHRVFSKIRNSQSVRIVLIVKDELEIIEIAELDIRHTNT